MTFPSIQSDYVRYPPETRVKDARGLQLLRESEAAGVYTLTEHERFWAEQQPYLLSRGYELRPRFRVGWKPFWYGTDIDPIYIEESIRRINFRVVDAKRISDGKIVGIKWVENTALSPDELDVMRYMSRDELRNDPRNHCNPLLDTFPHPTAGIFIVMPWLSNFGWCPIYDVYEVVDMLDQLLEGLEFMHEHGVAHRDCTNINIMQDVSGLFPGKLTHPINNSHSRDLRTLYVPLLRNKHNIRYYFIDFGLSSRHQGPGPHLVIGTSCRDKTVPELSRTVPYDPFKVDIYILGNHFLQAFLQKFSNLEFLRPLLKDMTRTIPGERPSAAQARSRLKAISRSLFMLQRYYRLCERNEKPSEVLVENVQYVARIVYQRFRPWYLVFLVAFGLAVGGLRRYSIEKGPRESL